MLTGFLKPTSGSIRVGDYSIDGPASGNQKNPRATCRSRPPVPRHAGATTTCGSSPTCGAWTPAASTARIRELGDLCGINEVMHQPIGELSKGYRQRVGLAHAMMDDPEVLVLDEPTSGLDPNQIVEIREIIRRIGKAKTVIFSTHILSEAEATCDRVAIIHRGKIAADSSTARLKETLGGRSQIHLTLAQADAGRGPAGARPRSRAWRAWRCSSRPTATLRLRARLRRRPRDPRPEIYRRIRQTSWVLLDFHQETQTLEDVFRELTKES
ncbi:MAG: ABC transporter ATP-binding protein [Desulfosudis oleivorans]|nr:ABC transporter ATP-binding protein [Desulfosudis oleivorans]